MQTYASNDGRVSDCFYTHFCAEAVSPTLLNRGPFFQRIFSRKIEAAKIILLQYASTTAEALLFFHGILYVRYCKQNCLLYAILHRKTESRNKVAVRLLTTGRSALTKSVGLGNFETAYIPHFASDRRTALLHVIIPRSDGFSPVSLRISLDEV